ncbi:MAG TPA: hypothetical protein VHZ24_02890 [Pirellulales bacterium]|nr:hypothetical protein [Pirellulales bacterium]
MKKCFLSALILFVSCGWLVATAAAVAADDSKTFDIAEGAFKLPVPEGWKSKQPATRIVEHEFEVPAAEGDERPGRVTVMGAGGSIDDNINRWCGQFEQPDGSNTRDKAVIKKHAIAGQDVTVVDISGTYDDRPPFAAAKGTQRPDYRMLAAIIETKRAGQPTGNYFIKFYGPGKTVGQNEAAFKKMIDGLEAK